MLYRAKLRETAEIDNENVCLTKRTASNAIHKFVRKTQENNRYMYVCIHI